jgi:D-aminoacyl-tRNA deacylase
MVTLIAISNGDIASRIQGEALLRKLKWDVLTLVEGHQAFCLKDVRLWFLPDRILWEDHLDDRWETSTGEVVREVLFPSRHSAVSGRPSLTLHPIGIPQVKIDEEIPYGGKAGCAVPPNPRISEWWKLFNQEITKYPSLEHFELTLEVTHHGPFLHAPSMFIEIGSTSETWGNLDAADFLSNIIIEGLGLRGSHQIGVWDESTARQDLVVMTLGGGHYAPRANHVGLLPRVRIGHMLATYSLPFGTLEHPDEQWKVSLHSAYMATKQAFPNGTIVCMIEKKAFKGWQRDLLKQYCEEMNLPIFQRKDVEAFSNSTKDKESVKD